MKHNNTRALYEYWNKQRDHENAPHRDKIDPSDIKWLLPTTFILEYKGEGNFPFSLAGTHLCDHYDMELRGLNMCDFWQGGDRESFVEILQSVVQECAVGVVGFSAHTNLEGSSKMELIVMPVKSPARKPPRILGSISVFDIPAWEGNDCEKIDRHEISGLRMMWPAREPAKPLSVFADLDPEKLESIDGNKFTAVKHLRVIDGGRRKQY